jgi:hypothetical protein
MKLLLLVALISAVAPAFAPAARAPVPQPSPCIEENEGEPELALSVMFAGPAGTFPFPASGAIDSVYAFRSKTDPTYYQVYVNGYAAGSGWLPQNNLYIGGQLHTLLDLSMTQPPPW